MTSVQHRLRTALQLSILVLVLYSCQKGPLDTWPGMHNIVTATGPVAHAGQDVYIKLPVDELTLNGRFTDVSNSIHKIEWKKISGPDSYSMDDPDKLSTRVRGLKEGTYSFELTVTNRFQLSGRDTVNITVLKADPDPVIVGEGEVTFTNINWIYPWYNALEAKQIYSFIPKDKPIRVFVKRDGSSNWIGVPPVSATGTSAYQYFIETRPDGGGIYTMGSLYVFYYGTDTEDTPDVKVVY